MKFIVDDFPVDIANVIYRDQGYGSDPGTPMSKYVLFLDNDELAGVFGGVFEEFVAHCKLDDQKFSDSDIPELKELGYPSLSQMLSAHREAFAGLLKDYLYFQILDALLSSNKRSNWRFAINEIVEVLDKGGGYALCGYGYKI